jgi:hypothetical protein
MGSDSSTFRCDCVTVTSSIFSVNEDFPCESRLTLGKIAANFGLTHARDCRGIMVSWYPGHVRTRPSADPSCLVAAYADVSGERRRLSRGAGGTNCHARLATGGGPGGEKLGTSGVGLGVSCHFR